MTYYLIKLFSSAILVVAISELAKRGSWFGALLASLPIVSLLAMVWLYLDTRDTQKIAQLSNDILWLVLPSLVFFAVLPLLLKAKLNFWLSMAVALAIMFACYVLMTAFIKKNGM